MDLLNESPSTLVSSHRNRFTALSCIRLMIITELIIKIIKIVSISTVLFLKRNEPCKQPLKAFLGVFLVITIIRSIIFLSKNRSFFNIQIISDYRDNPDLALFSNFIEALVLFWYLIGFHWLQECTNCSNTNRVLYYMTALFITIGIAMFVLPLMAIIALLLLKECVKPKLKVVKFNDQADLPDESCTCTICFEQYEIGNEVKFLPCSHHFHCTCVDEWLSLKESCPLCKRSTGFFNELLDEQYDDFIN
ncbi:E3 ubiquitin-protein ligase RNF13 [Vairimorpha necatrix]|uniref:E3 ubiquitin-protein ligase RNF13 n=1 Tax=Vairimorpha necatrix TaxID=6039 RepID=A0AAX4J8Z3_9MICR